jgi:hypothetical protein
LNVLRLGACANGLEDDRAAIESALDTAAWLSGDVDFPPDKYIVGRSGTNSWCLDMPGDNLTLRGGKGASWIKVAPGMPGTPVAVLRINARSNITLSGLGIDGNWGNAPLSIVGGKFLTGSQTVWARKFRVRDCTIDGACVIASAGDVVLERNRIVTDFDGNSYAPVLVSFFCDDIWVLDNEIYDRTADASAGRHAGSIWGGAADEGYASLWLTNNVTKTLRG